MYRKTMKKIKTKKETNKQNKTIQKDKKIHLSTYIHAHQTSVALIPEEWVFLVQNLMIK